jgi:hypothetical protein
MPSPYQEFLAKARERAAAEKGTKSLSIGGRGELVFTKHSEYKMRQYNLSGQKVRGVIRNPKRREVGIMPKTVAVMQPLSVKKENGKETWKQEIWVMYKEEGSKKRVISAWRYPGISPKRDPIPSDILRELLDGSILEEN